MVLTFPKWRCIINMCLWHLANIKERIGVTQREQQILQLIENDPLISQQQLAETLGITRSSAAVHISNLMKKGYIAGKGYILSSSNYAVVVGGVNVDIGGRSFAPLVQADSNPGSVTTSLGGVGRNIAHNLSQIGVEVHLLTAFGDDANGERVATSCTQLGIDLRHALRIPGAATSTYLYLTDPNGEMALAVSDMAVCEEITPDYLASNLSLLNNAKAVVLDTNIPEESLRFLAEHCTVPLFVDPVSTTKAKKLLPILHKIHTLKPNQLEAELLTGIRIRTREDVELAAQRLLEKGVRRVFLTRGSEGVYAASAEGYLWHPVLEGSMVNTTGCGDSFMGALVWAFLQELDLETTARAGLAASAITMESSQTINPVMNEETLLERMNRKKL